MILLAKQECYHPSPRATARVPTLSAPVNSERTAGSPLPKGDRKGPHPHSTPLPPIQRYGSSPPAVFVSVASIIMKYLSDERNADAQ